MKISRDDAECGASVLSLFVTNAAHLPQSNEAGRSGHQSNQGQNMVVQTIYPMIIDGQKIHTDRHIDVINPATGAVFASAARADEPVLDAAVGAAQRAFPAWSATPLPKRAALMHQLADSLQEHAAEFARLIVMEQGKPLAEAQTEVATGVRREARRDHPALHVSPRGNLERDSTARRFQRDLRR